MLFEHNTVYVFFPLKIFIIVIHPVLTLSFQLFAPTYKVDNAHIVANIQNISASGTCYHSLGLPAILIHSSSIMTAILPLFFSALTWLPEFYKVSLTSVSECMENKFQDLGKTLLYAKCTISIWFATWIQFYFSWQRKQGIVNIQIFI